MKKIFFSIVMLLYLQCAFAQWSVLEGDPRTQNGESHLYQVFTSAEWNASNFAKPADMKWFDDARFGMFIHFGLSSYVKKDLSWPIVYNRKAPDGGHGDYPDSAWQKTWPSLMKLEKFNADEWVKIAKDAGMKYITVITKHHDGFHMWDTEFSDFKITNTPFKRDYLKEVIDACHKANMPVGLYYSQRDWYHPDYAPVDTSIAKGKPRQQGPTHAKYIAYQFNVVKELCTKYGKIDMFWFDAAWWNDMFTADMWDAEKLTRMVRKLQPGIIINNRVSLPGDFDTPEQRIGMYQKRSWESAITLNGKWAYDPAPVKPVKTLLQEILSASAGNGNVLLSWGAHFDGEFDPVQKDSLLRIGNWMKKYGRVYYGTRGGPWMPTRNIGSVHKDNKIFLYVFNWEGENITLPMLKGNSIKKVSFINVAEKIDWKMANDKITLIQPSAPAEMVTVIEIEMANPITEVIETSSASLFDDPAYGKMILQKDIKPGDWKAGQLIVDLGKVKSVTGIGLYPNSGKIKISTSANKVDWQEAEINTSQLTEISLTTFVSGANVPGKEVKYIKLQSKNKLMKLKVYAK